MNVPNLVLYHAGCWDGFCAAWVIHQAYPGMVEFQPVQYGQEPPDVMGLHVWIVDFSYKRPALLKMKEQAASLLVLDHHKTAQADLEGLDFCLFDMGKSGARMTWMYLHPDRESPWLVNYTEDRDLWLHVLPLTKEINAGLRTMPLDFTAWDLIDANPDSQRICASEGVGIIRYQSKIVESHTRHAAEIEIMGHKVLCVNCTCADLTSEVAGTLAVGRPFGVCWFESDENQRIFSLRSAPDGIDVAEIAKAHGGGGHKHAAGFSQPATGALGTFSKGQIHETDEGDLRLAIATDKRAGIVRIDFGTPTVWIGMPQNEAMQFAERIRFAASKL